MSKTLEKYLLSYKGIDDPFRNTLLVLKNNFQITRVLYPGSWIHLTPSLVFPFVVYVDSLSNIKRMFDDPQLIEYIRKHSKISEPCIKAHETDYRQKINEEEDSFDLILSLNSGFVSQYCSKYLKKNGLLLANNGHYDAIKAYTDKENYKVTGIFPNSSTLKVKDLDAYFLTKNNLIITSDMVIENSKKPPSKAKYQLKKKALYYLFKKI
ncbi:MAG: hypothetical protein ACQCN6_03880 [Candidatus Bathyarchaeia archaeon]|jgi:hypothetical protein